MSTLNSGVCSSNDTYLTTSSDNFSFNFHHSHWCQFKYTQTNWFTTNCYSQLKFLSFYWLHLLLQSAVGCFCSLFPSLLQTTTDISSKKLFFFLLLQFFFRFFFIFQDIYMYKLEQKSKIHIRNYNSYHRGVWFSPRNGIFCIPYKLR